MEATGPLIPTLLARRRRIFITVSAMSHLILAAWVVIRALPLDSELISYVTR